MRGVCKIRPARRGGKENAMIFVFSRREKDEGRRARERRF